MSRHRILGIAHGLSGCINNRNNSIHGFWGMGYFYNSLYHINREEITIDLYTGQSSPSLTYVNDFSTNCRHFLFQQCERNQLPKRAIVGASLHLAYNINPPTEPIVISYGKILYPNPGSYRSYYRSTLRIHSDLGKEYCVAHTYWCWRYPHIFVCHDFPDQMKSRVVGHSSDKPAVIKDDHVLYHTALEYCSNREYHKARALLHHNISPTAHFFARASAVQSSGHKVGCQSLLYQIENLIFSTPTERIRPFCLER